MPPLAPTSPSSPIRATTHSRTHKAAPRPVRLLPSRPRASRRGDLAGAHLAGGPVADLVSLRPLMPAPPPLPSSAPPDWIGGIEPPPPPGTPPPRPTSSTTTSPDCLHSVRVVSDLHLALHCPVPMPRGEDPGPPLSPLSPCTPTTLTTTPPHPRPRLRARTCVPELALWAARAHPTPGPAPVRP
nr:sulfated surface glycoprotein 185-like [Aegilops tauschii subsp. strangulata]